MLSRSLFQSMRHANPTPHLRQSWLGGHFENDCKLLASNRHVDVAQPPRAYLLAWVRADGKMPHKWWIFRHLFGVDGGFLP
jgi:hypothetical protein